MSKKLTQEQIDNIFFMIPVIFGILMIISLAYFIIKDYTNTIDNKRQDFCSSLKSDYYISSDKGYPVCANKDGQTVRMPIELLN